MNQTVTPNPRTKEQNRRLWWIAGQLGISREAMADIVLEFTNGRTCHTSELGFLECRELMVFLKGTLNGSSTRKGQSDHIDQKPDNDPEKVKLDRKRKGVIKAIFRWLELRGVHDVSVEYVKGIACRAAKADSFNRISPEALSRIYAEFCHKQEAIQGGMRDVIGEMAVSN
jgi:hypothetical protein